VSSTIRKEATRLTRRGDYAGALRALGAPSLPDLDAFFPSETGRQDLDHEQDFGLRRRRPALLAARRLVLGAGLSSGERDLLLGYVDLFLGEYARARTCLGRVAAARGGHGPHLLHAMALWLLGDKLRTRELLPEALAAADAAVAADPGPFHAYPLRGGLRREAEDVDGAVADARRALERRPDFVWSRVELLELIAGEGRYREAVRHADALLRRFPDASWAWAQRARLHGLAGDAAKALADFEQALRRDPKDGAVTAWRAEALRRLGRHADARAGFDRAVALDPRYRLARQWRGRQSLLLGRPKAALADFEAALALEPRDRLMAGWRGQARWLLGRHRQAAEDFEEAFPAPAATLWNARLKAGETQESYYLLDAVGGKRLAAFRADVEAGAAAAPRCAWAQAFRGRCLVEAGKLAPALAAFDAALALDPRHGYALSWKGEALRRLGRREEALDALDRGAVLARGTASRWAWARLGLVLAELGRDAEAVAAFERALPPGDQRFACGWLWNAQSLRRLGRGEEALEAARRARRLDPKTPGLEAWLLRHAGRKAAAA
jgi:tetratricopeptide (TPR) repeat protein